MNVALNRNLAIASALVVSALSISGSASAASRPQPRPIKCTCMGRYVPPKLCPMIHCPEASTDATMIGDRRPSTDIAGIQLPPISTKDLVAGRYRTRGTAGGIGRGIESTNILLAEHERHDTLDGSIVINS